MHDAEVKYCNLKSNRRQSYSEISIMNRSYKHVQHRGYSKLLVTLKMETYRSNNHTPTQTHSHTQQSGC